MFSLIRKWFTHRKPAKHRNRKPPAAPRQRLRPVEQLEDRSLLSISSLISSVDHYDRTETVDQIESNAVMQSSADNQGGWVCDPDTIYLVAQQISAEDCAGATPGPDDDLPRPSVFLAVDPNNPHDESAVSIDWGDGATDDLLNTSAAYPGFNGGVTVAAGDVNGDGITDIITGAGNDAVQKVRLFDGVSLAALDSFFALDPRTSKGLLVESSR